MDEYLNMAKLKFQKMNLKISIVQSDEIRYIKLFEMQKEKNTYKLVFFRMNYNR